MGPGDAGGGALPPGREDRRDAPLGQERLAGPAGAKLPLPVGVGGRQGHERVRRRRGDRPVHGRPVAAHQLAHQALHERQVEPGDLGLERRAILRAEAGERVGQPVLARRPEDVLRAHAGVRATLVTPSARAAMSR